MTAGPLYLIGTSGSPNFGDEFITAAWLKHLAAAAPDTEVWLDYPQPGPAQSLFAGLHPQLRVTDTLWRIARDTAHLAPAEAGARAMELVKHLGSPHYDLGLLKLREALSLHLLGGGYINNIWSHQAGLVHAMRAVRELTGARLFATGQGLMPVTGPNPEKLFEGFSHVTARDRESAQAYGVSLGLDDAFLDAAGEIARSDGTAEGLYICIQGDMGTEDRFGSAVATARGLAEQATAAGRSVHYVEAIPGVDRRAYELLADLIPAENFLPFAHIWNHGLPLSAKQTWVTTRFHFHLLASAAGACGVALAVRPGYYDVKHRSLLQLGSGWSYRSDAGQVDIPADPGPLAGRLAALAAAKLAEAHELYPALPAPAGSGPLSGRASRFRDSLLRRSNRYLRR